MKKKWRQIQVLIKNKVKFDNKQNSNLNPFERN